MFGPRKTLGYSKIKLPKAASAPAFNDLQYLFLQARDNRGREVEITWFESMLAKTFTLGCKYDRQALTPTWTLWEDDGIQSKLTWQYDTNDFNLVVDVLSMVEKRTGGSTQIDMPAAPPSSNALSQRANATPGVPQRQLISTSTIPPFSPMNRPNQSSTVLAPQPAPARPANALEGDLTVNPMPQLLGALSVNRATGKLEIKGQDSMGEIYFESGVTTHAETPAEYGDAAIKELIAFEAGHYTFIPEVTTTLRSVHKQLQTVISEGVQLLDQKRLLKNAGLSFDSYLVRKHKNLSETELKLMLSKGAPLDWNVQKNVYDYLARKRTVAELLRDRPMEATLWTTLLFNFLSCGLIDIKAPESKTASPLDFLGEATSQAATLVSQLIRPETGLYSYEALLFFLQYEFYRFQAYDYPLSLVVFEMQQVRRDRALEAVDRLPSQAVAAAAQRIALIKRPLDTLAHFEALDFALLMPNTKSASASFVINKIYEALTAVPLNANVDRNNMTLAFGISCLPGDGEDLQSLIAAAKDSKLRAKQGTFPIVVGRGAGKK